MEELYFGLIIKGDKEMIKKRTLDSTPTVIKMYEDQNDFIKEQADKHNLKLAEIHRQLVDMGIQQQIKVVEDGK